MKTNHPLDEIIHSNLPLSRLSEFYPETTTALQEYGRAMQQRFKSSNPDECEICRIKPGTLTEAYIWQTMVNPAFTFTKFDFLMLFLGRAGVTLQQTVIGFQTLHCLCPGCSTVAKTRRTLSVLVKSISFFLLLTCLALTIMGGGGVLYSLKNSGTFETGFAAVFGCGLLGLILACYGHRWEKQLRIPAPFRPIGRSPFWLEKVQTLR